MIVEVYQDTPLASGDVVTYRVSVNVFGNSTAVSQTNAGTIQLNLSSCVVRILSDDNHVDLKGNASADFRLIQGTIDLRRMNISGLRGDYHGHRIILEEFVDGAVEIPISDFSPKS